MKKISFIFIILVLVFSISCNKKYQKESVAYEYASVEETVPAEAPADGGSYNRSEQNDDFEVTKPTSGVKKKIIKDGTMSIKSKKITESKSVLDKIIKDNNAYYETEDLTNTERVITYILKIRIPAENFEKFIAELEKGKDEIESKSINAKDVTEEFLDIEARLNNKKAYLERYKNLLNKANTVKDILEIEENIRNLQEEIESKEGRLKYLNDQVAFSTLFINLFENKDFVYKSEERDSFFQRIKKSLSIGWSSVIDFIIGFISLWPFWLVLIVAIIVFRKIRKKRKTAKTTTN